MPAPLPSQLDSEQILQRVFDEDTGQLRTSAEATIINADIDVALDSAEDSVEIANAAGVPLKIETDGSTNTNATQVGIYDVEEIQPTNSTVTFINASTTNQIVVNTNPDRKGVILNKQGTGIAYLKLGANASTTSYTLEMTNNTTYELPFPCYTGRIDVVFNNTAGTLRITELY